MLGTVQHHIPKDFTPKWVSYIFTHLLVIFSLHTPDVSQMIILPCRKCFNFTLNMKFLCWGTYFSCPTSQLHRAKSCFRSKYFNLLRTSQICSLKTHYHVYSGSPLILICVKPGGPRWRSWLRHCATSQKVAGSIPDGVIGIFHWHNPSGRTVALRLTWPLTEMSTGNISWG